MWSWIIYKSILAAGGKASVGEILVEELAQAEGGAEPPPLQHPEISKCVDSSYVLRCLFAYSFAHTGALD
jgi:hypothetical protein